MNTGTEILSPRSVICLDVMAVIGARSFGLKLILSDSEFWMKIVHCVLNFEHYICRGQKRLFLQWKQKAKMSFSYWSCFLCIDCEPLDNTRICQTDDEVWRLSLRIVTLHQHVSCQTTRGQSHVAGCRSHQPPVSSCQKHLKLGKQWTPQHNANNRQPLPPHQTIQNTTVHYSFMILKERFKNHWRNLCGAHQSAE